MKKISLILMIALFATVYVQAKEKKDDVKQANAKFKKESHDFGKIHEEINKATYDFQFKNTGNAPLIIQRVATSCGCTTPSYSKEPILPGKKGDIKISYSTTGRVGNFTKRITIFTNVPDTTYTLHITGEVLAREAVKTK